MNVQNATKLYSTIDCKSLRLRQVVGQTDQRVIFSADSHPWKLFTEECVFKAQMDRKAHLIVIMKRYSLG